MGELAAFHDAETLGLGNGRTDGVHLHQEPKMSTFGMEKIGQKIDFKPSLDCLLHSIPDQIIQTSRAALRKDESEGDSCATIKQLIDTTQLSLEI